jgi:hypothetical protein
VIVFSNELQMRGRSRKTFRDRKLPTARRSLTTPEMMSLSDFDFRDVKLSPIRARGDARDPFEQPAKKRRVFVTHIPADLIHRRMRSFEPPLRLFHAQSLNV